MTDSLTSPVRTITSLAVFTGSAHGNAPEFAAVATQLGEALATERIRVVYGGGRVGLMGVVAEAAMRAGGEVIGVIPESLMRDEVGNADITQLEVVPNMHVRKARMAELADGFVALPGGVGTLEELFEVWTWQQLGIHQKPVAVLNVSGFWDPLLTALDHMTDSGFMTPRFRDTLIVADTPENLVRQCAVWQPEPPKWRSNEHSK